jgi:D-alanyl-D-alanine carboxypeptidase
MKDILITGLVCISTIFSYAQAVPTSCEPGITINSNHSKGLVFDSIMKKYSPKILPGMAIAVYTEKEGWWASAAGYANIENKTPMENCHLQYLQSVSKSYMAVEILQLKEQGKIILDSPMTKYLPAKYSRYIKDAEKITVRMLLNHRSGVPEYNENAGFISKFIEHPVNIFTREECLESIAGEELMFTPGTKYLYINTNYLLLSLIGDAITGDHAAYIKKNIFKTLGLTNTHYGNGSKYLDGLNLPDSYWDVFNIGVPVKITNIQKATVVSTKGDDGIVCTPADAVKYFKGLMEGKLLNAESMKELLDFVKDEKGHNRYGMGIIYFDLDGVPAYGHGGGGMGAGCGLIYVPSRKIYLFFSTNLGVFVENDLVKKAGEMRDEIFAELRK